VVLTGMFFAVLRVRQIEGHQTVDSQRLNEFGHKSSPRLW